jgi:hypothetical protein
MLQKLRQIAKEPIFISFGIKNYPCHFFDSDFNLYQISYCPRFRTLPTKKLAKVKIGRCMGFKIDSKFKSLSNLQEKIYPLTRVVLPIDLGKEYTPF